MASLTYYQILEIRRDANDAEVKAAYRRLALRYHPDHADEADAEERFKAVAEAYRILSDAELRGAYDRFGRVPPWATFGPSSSLLVVRRENPIVGGLRAVRQRVEQRMKAQRGEDLQVETELSFAEAANGCRRVFELPGRDDRGQLTRRRLEFAIPAGVVEGRVLRWAEWGAPGLHGGRPGDLRIRVSVRPHPVLRREGRDTVATLPLRLAEWLGAAVRVPTVLGPRTLEVPAGCAPGDELRVVGCGVADPDGRRGDARFVLAFVPAPPVDASTRDAFRAADASIPATAWPDRARFDACIDAEAR